VHRLRLVALSAASMTSGHKDAQGPVTDAASIAQPLIEKAARGPWFVRATVANCRGRSCRLVNMELAGRSGRIAAVGQQQLAFTSAPRRVPLAMRGRMVGDYSRWLLELVR